MASLKVEVADLIVTITFTTKDLYMSTPLGCHAGCFGNVHSSCRQKDDFKGWGASMGEPANQKKFQEGDLYRKIMDELVKGAPEAWGGWDSSGTGYRKKGHWIISAPWGFNPESDYAPGEIGTRELMDLISQYCDHEPEKYGRYTMTDGTDCGAHDNNSGRPCTRTMIWHPPGIIVTKENLLTRLSNVYKPIEVKKPDPVKVVTAKPTKVKLPRPQRRDFQTKQVKKQYGPAPRLKYQRAA